MICPLVVKLARERSWSSKMCIRDRHSVVFVALTYILEPNALGEQKSKAAQLGVKRVSIPSHDTKSPARKQRQKQRWFKELQKWRTGCEGRISVLKRRHGMRRSLYKRCV